MVIFNSYVKLPEGITYVNQISIVDGGQRNNLYPSSRFSLFPLACHGKEFGVVDLSGQKFK